MNTHDVALDAQTPTTLLLSAETPAALDQATQDLAAWLAESCRSGYAPCPLPEEAAALRDQCTVLAHRRAVYVESWQDALAALGDKSRHATAATIAGTPRLFVSFPGQGSLRPGVLARLLAQAPEWASHLARLGQLAREISGFDCAAWLADSHADADSVLKDNAKTQLAIFCVGVSLGRWLLDLGLRPDGYVGHSLGEWMGATLAGVLSEAHAVLAVHHRGLLMQSTAPGAALIVRQTPDALLPQLSADVALACVNAPNLCLVSGRPDAIARCAEQLSAARVVCRPAPIHVAVHSPIMDAVIEPFLGELLPLEFRAPKTPILSTVTGQWMSEEQARDPRYWAQQLRSQVRFEKAGATLLAEPSAVVLEVGMGSALTSLLTTQQVGRYAIFDEIAAGGMATVHLARLVGSGGFSRVVAAKRMHRHFLQDSKFRSMFLAAVWVNLAANTVNQNWERIFDFGNGSTANNFLYLVARAGDPSTNPVQFVISTKGHSASSGQTIHSPATLTPNVWHHLAIVLPAGSTYTGTMYIDGLAVATNTAMTLHASDMGATNNNYLGRSQFSGASSGDPLFNGSLDDFRVYKRALSPQEISDLFALR